MSIRGFTLIEVLVSISILLIILSTIVLRFTSLDSITLLRTLAYDIGLSMREAQSYSLSAFGTGGSFRTPYGLSFTPGETSYVFFSYGGSEIIPRYDASAVPVDLYKLGRSFQVSDVCVTVGGSEDCSIASLDISFKRPEYTSYFYVPGYAGDLSAIEAGTVKIASTKNSDIVASIRITYTGQIDVTVE